jgi:hypothetical protein
MIGPSWILKLSLGICLRLSFVRDSGSIRSIGSRCLPFLTNLSFVNKPNNSGHLRQWRNKNKKAANRYAGS